MLFRSESTQPLLGNISRMTRALSVAVRVKPGAQREHVGGSYPGPYGPALVISVRARAVDGAATEATLGQRITNLLAPATS